MADHFGTVEWPMCQPRCSKVFKLRVNHDNSSEKLKWPFLWLFQFEADAGFQRFIATHFQLDTAPERDKERALERLKKLYDQVLADYVEELVASSTQQVS